MQVYPNQLTKQLNSKLDAIYFIHGDEPLLSYEARQQIYKKARQQGFEQKEIITIDANFKWETLESHLYNQTLFADKTILDIRNPSAKFSTAGTKILSQYFDNPASDIVIIITSDKLSADKKRTKWFKLIDKMGVHIPIWPIKPEQLSGWITQRLKHHHLTAESDAIDMLAAYTEGNLMATQQAIEKLGLLYDHSRLSVTQMNAVISHNYKFSIFDLTDYCLEGQYQKVLHALSHLEHSKAEPVLVLWAITRELRALYKLALQKEQGISMPQILKSQWAARKNKVERGLMRLNTQKIHDLIQQAHHCDLVTKSITSGNTWESLTQLCLSFCGKTPIKRAISYG